MLGKWVMKELGWPWKKQMCRGKWARWQTAHSCLSPLDGPTRKTLPIYHPLKQVQSWKIVKAWNPENCKGLWAVYDLHNEAQDNFNIPKVFSAWPCHRKAESAPVTLEVDAWNLPCATSLVMPKHQKECPEWTATMWLTSCSVSVGGVYNCVWVVDSAGKYFIVLKKLSDGLQLQYLLH